MRHAGTTPDRDEDRLGRRARLLAAAAVAAVLVVMVALHLTGVVGPNGHWLSTRRTHDDTRDLPPLRHGYHGRG